LTHSEAVLVLRRDEPYGAIAGTLRLQLIGANHLAQPTGLDELPGKANYLVGNDPARWRTNVPTYGKVLYRQVYQGVDVIFYGRGRELEFDCIVAPGADPGVIRLGLVGAEKVEIDGEGDLVLSLAGELVRIKSPMIYQKQERGHRQIAGGYVLLSSADDSKTGSPEVAFRVGPYDVKRSLVIDPTLVYSSYLGGSAAEQAFLNGVDASRSAYVVGRTFSLDFPTVSPAQASFAGLVDAFVTKIDATGSVILYSTYLGGSGVDSPIGLAVDSGGNAYVVGSTDSSDFPTVNPAQAAGAGGFDAFVTKLNATGSVVYSTYLGGSSRENGAGIAPDGNGNAYVTGTTLSADFPVLNPLQPMPAGGGDAFVTKLSSAGAFVYSTYLGGTGEENGASVGLDATGNVYIIGSTISTDFPTVNAFQPTNAGGFDGFLTKLNPAGTALVYSTYLGGSATESALEIAVEGNGNVHLSGPTMSGDFPTVNALQAASGGGLDAFVTKVNPAGGLVYSTYLGGSGTDGSGGVAVDPSGNTYVLGSTASTDFPVANALQATFAGGPFDVFIAKISSGGATLLYSTYLGGNARDFGGGIAGDACSAYIAGFTESANFPTANAFQPVLAGPSDAFVAQLAQTSQELIQGLINEGNGLVSAGVLNNGQGNALNTKLQAALDALAQGNTNGAINQLQAFMNQVSAFVNAGTLTQAQAQVLLDAANEAIAVVNC